MDASVVHVVVGVMYNASGQILVARRLDHVHQGGKLEFPGGKVEQGESVSYALAREFKEELGVEIDTTSIKPLICLTHHYPDKAVKLDVWEIAEFEGEPSGQEGQPIHWLSKSELKPCDFPAANAPIISALNLPDALMVTPDVSFEYAITELPQRIQSSGVTHCIVRLPSLTLEEYSQVWATLKTHIDTTAVELIVHQHVALAILDKASLHLPSHQLNVLSKADCPEWLRLSASVHSHSQQEKAEELGARFTVFGSVKSTPSHEGEHGVGWSAFNDVTRSAYIPVYAIGGMTKQDIATARLQGGQGVAGIRLFSAHNQKMIKTPRQE